MLTVQIQPLSSFVSIAQTTLSFSNNWQPSSCQKGLPWQASHELWWWVNIHAMILSICKLVARWLLAFKISPYNILWWKFLIMTTCPYWIQIPNEFQVTECRVIPRHVSSLCVCLPLPLQAPPSNSGKDLHLYRMYIKIHCLFIIVYLHFIPVLSYTHWTCKYPKNFKSTLTKALQAP